MTRKRVLTLHLKILILNFPREDMNDEYILKTFESIGIPKMQTVIYLDLLRNNESSATEVSKRTKMHRANVYDNLTKLKQRNLVYLSIKEGRQVFAALPSELIVHEENDRMENLKLAMDYIKTIYLPRQIPKVYTVEGIKAVKSLLFGILEKEADFVWVYGLSENGPMVEVLNDRMMNLFHVERIKKEIKMRLLFDKLPVDGIEQFTKLKLVETKILPKREQKDSSQITQIVCKGSVYITLWLDPVCTIVIENDVIAKEYSDLYEVLWNSSKVIK